MHFVKFLSCFVPFLLTGMVHGQLVESFDGWTDDGSYAGTATYVSPGVGTWVSENALAASDNARSGNAVRFNDDSASPWLEFQGSSGNGVDGGVDTVSFYYRHWNGQADAVAFQLQYRVGAGAWVNAGPEIAVPQDTIYRHFSHSLGLTDDGVTLRILSTANDERLLIDDFEIGAATGGPDPVVGFTDISRTVGEVDGTIFVPLQISPAASATVDVSVISGDATPGVDYTWSPSRLVFSTAAPIQNLSITLENEEVVENAEFVEWEIASVIGGVINPGADRFTLTIDDDDRVENTNEVIFTVMAANTTSGNYQSYQGPGIRIFQALQPDIVAIQEFNTDHAGGVRGFVDDVFGTNYSYMIEGGDEQIPNGVISRWPITAAGEWNDPQVSNRDFAWATIDIPGETDLHVISVHLHNSGGASSRSAEAAVIVPLVQSSFPASDYIVIAGDFNTGSRTEGCIQTLKDVFVDTHVPADQFGDDDTNAGRSKPYDWVMVNPALDTLHEPVVVGGTTFPDGIVFDTRLWASPPSPALVGDSGAANMQHMAVVKAFAIPGPPPAPVSLTVHSTHGSPVPSPGVTSHAYGSVITPRVPDPIVTMGTTQYVVTGWTGSGSVPAFGTGDTLPAVTLVGPSTLSWQWRTNYWLSTTDATPVSQWLESGTTASIVPAISNYYSFAGWVGDLDPGQAADNPLLLVMDQSRSASATRSADQAAQGTPHYWLAMFGWTTGFDVAERLDSDGDGMAAWEEYIAGTLPDSGNSRFVVHGVLQGGPIDITFDTQPGRRYRIEWIDDLGSAVWQPFADPALGTFDESGSTVTHTFRDDFGPGTTGTVPAGGHRVYRLRVEKP